MNKAGGEEEFDPREIFTKLFGGEAFYDYVGICYRLLRMKLIKDW